MGKSIKSSQKGSSQAGQSTQSSGQSQPGQSQQGQQQKSGASQKDADALLKEDHRKVEGLFRQFESAGDSTRKRELARQICHELIIHSKIEEEIFYPACRAKDVEDDALDEAQVEHDTLKVLIGDLLSRDPGSSFYDAKVTVLSEYVKHHVAEEENPGTGIFAKARKADVDMAALGTRLQERKQRLATMAESGDLEPSPPRALSLQSRAFNQERQETDMARRNDTERDDRGRFMDEDDPRGGSRGRYGSGDDDRNYYGPGRVEDRGRYASRGGYAENYRYQRGGEFGGGGYGGSGYGGVGSSSGGSGGSYAAGYGGGYGTGSGGGYDRDWDIERGSGSPRGYSQESRGGWQRDDEDNGGSRGGRGSRAGMPERDEYGRFMSDDDNGGMGAGSRREMRGGSRGGFERERDEYGRFTGDDDNGGMRGGYRGGRGSRSGSGMERDEYGRFASDDNRGSRSSSGSSRGGSQGSRSGGNDDNRGWYGDHRRHAEAARRGWQNRDD